MKCRRHISESQTFKIVQFDAPYTKHMQMFAHIYKLFPDEMWTPK